MKFKDFYLKEMIGKRYEFSCLLFDFPKTISQEIQNWCKFNVQSDVLVKDGRENETHVTLLYGVEESDPQSSFSLLRNFKPFEIILGEMTKFDAPDCDVLKIDVFGQELHALRNFIEANIDNTQTHPEYKPHITLAYVAKGSCDRFIGNDLFKGRKVLVDAIDFSSYNGHRKRMYLKNA